MVYLAEGIAKYIIWHEWEAKRPVSNLRLQKLLYFVQVLCICLDGSPLFKDKIYGWDCGPVVPEIYEKYRKYGSMIIQDVEDCSNAPIFKTDKEHIDLMLEECASKSNTELLNITLNQLPWRMANAGYTANREITVDSMKKYFNNPKE